MNNEAKCWLCGRRVEGRRVGDLVPHSGIPIHRECLEGPDRSQAESPVGQPEDIVYF